MLEVRLAPRFFVLLVAALLISACAYRQASAPTPGPGSAPSLRAGNPCASGAKPAVSKQAPIVCIDDSARTLVVFPDPVVIHDVKASDRSSPVPVQWFTTSGIGDVHVEVQPGCIDKKTCDGSGKCWAETVPGARKSCKYDVWVTDGKHDRLDPTVVVEGCCP